MIPEDTIRRARLVTMVLYGVAFGGLLAGTSGGDELSGASIAIGTVAASGFVFALISYVRARARGHRLETIRGYFRDVQFVATNLTLGVLCIFCAILLSPEGLRYLHISAVPLWYLPVIVAISVHQFVRAAHRVTANWRTVDDVLQGMRSGAVTTQRFSATYDIGFFVGMSIAISIASRYFGSGGVLLLGGVIGALSFPYALGSVVYQRVVLARLLPNDMPLPDWYAVMSARHNSGNTPARAARRSRHTTPARRNTRSHL